MLEKALLFRSKLAEIQFCFMGNEDILNKFWTSFYFRIKVSMKARFFFFFKNYSLIFFWERIWISADLPRMEMNRCDIMMSFPELPGCQKTLPWIRNSELGSGGLRAKFARALMELCFMRRRLDILSPLRPPWSISSQFHVYLAFHMPYQMKKLSSHFENGYKERERGQCQGIISFLHNLPLESLQLRATRK